MSRWRSGKTPSVPRSGMRSKTCGGQYPCSRCRRAARRERQMTANGPKFSAGETDVAVREPEHGLAGHLPPQCPSSIRPSHAVSPMFSGDMPHEMTLPAELIRIRVAFTGPCAPDGTAASDVSFCRSDRHTSNLRPIRGPRELSMKIVTSSRRHVVRYPSRTKVRGDLRAEEYRAGRRRRRAVSRPHAGARHRGRWSAQDSCQRPLADSKPVL